MATTVVLSAVDDGMSTGTFILTFDGPTDTADWNPSWIEVDWGSGPTPSDSVAQVSANVIAVTNLNGFTDPAGQLWNFLFQPPYVAPGQSGTIT